MTFWQKNKWPLAIYLAAFLIRLIHLIQYQSNPVFYYPMVDELWHWRWAGDILRESFTGNEAYFRGPLYPYFLAFFRLITGDSIFVSRLLQCFIAGGSAVFVYALGKKLLSEKIGIAAGLGYALFGTLVFYETMFLIPVLFVFLNLWAIYLLIRLKEETTIKYSLYAGLVTGLSAIARPNILILVPLFLIWIYLTVQAIRGRPQAIRSMIIYFLSLMVPVLAVTVRNYAVTGEFILISSQGGVNLYIGNNPDTEGLTMLMPEVKLDESLPWTEFTEATREAAERETGRELTAGEESNFWTTKALKFIVSNPGKFITMTFKKLVYFISGFENSDQTDIYDSRNYSTLLRMLIWKGPIYFPYGLVLPLALAGMAIFWRDRKKLALFYIFIIGYIPTVILFLVTARHRLPIVPFLLLFAAGAVFELIHYFKNNKPKKFFKYVAILIVLLVGCNMTYFDLGFENEFQTHFNLGLTYERQGNLSGAEREYNKALSFSASAAGYNNLGYVQYLQGKADAALQSYRKALRVDPNYAEAYNNIGLVFESQNNYEQAVQYYNRALEIDPELHQAHINLGDVYLAQMNYSSAEQAYLRAKSAAPERGDPYFKLAGLYARMSRFDEALSMFRQGERYGEPKAVDYVNRANVYYSTRKPNQAIPLYHQAIKMDSSLPQAYFGLALTFHNYRYPKDSALFYLDLLLEKNPNFEPARQLQQQIIP